MKTETPTLAPKRALVLKARIIERKALIQESIRDGSSEWRIEALRRLQAEDEREYRQLIDNL